MRQEREGAEDDLRHEAEGALAADDEPGEDVDRGVEIEEGVETVPHGVLHREQAGDGAHRLGVGAHAIAEPDQAVEEFGLVMTEPRLGIGLRRVDDRAARQYEDHRFDGAVARPLDAASHSGGVVRHDAADGAGRLARGVGAELATIAQQTVVHLSHCRAGLDAHPQPVVEDRDLPEVLAHVHEDAVGQRLSAQAGAAGAQRRPDAESRAGAEHGAHVGAVARDDLDLGDEQEVRGVVSVRMEVDRSIGHRYARAESRRQAVARREGSVW